MNTEDKSKEKIISGGIEPFIRVDEDGCVTLSEKQISEIVRRVKEVIKDSNANPA